MREPFRTILAAMAVAMVLTPAAAQKAEVPIRILAFGDSLTAGYGVEPVASFPNQLERALKAKGLNVEVLNAGVSGDTTAGGLGRLEDLLKDAKNTPDGAIVELGINDGFHGLPPAVIEKNLDAILAKLKARNISVLLTGIRGAGYFDEHYTAQFDAVFPRLAKKYDALFYPFFLEGAAGDPQLIQPDGLHPNAKGIQVVVSRILPLAVQLVERAQSHRAGAQAPRP